MKKRALCAALCLILCIALGGQVFAAENDVSTSIEEIDPAPTVEVEETVEEDPAVDPVVDPVEEEPEEEEVPAETEEPAANNGVSILVNGTALPPTADVLVENCTTYVSYWPVVRILYPEATAVWEGNHALVTADGLNMKIWTSTCYLEVNDRYLYLEDGTRVVDGNILVPIRVLAKALGAEVVWNAETMGIEVVGSGTPIESGDTFYPSEDLYWLSRIIYAESGNQPMAGKIAVGNVVLNRVADPRFPSTVYGVVFQRNQFTPASNGTIYRTPNSGSVIAAKLCLEGANTAGNSLYFVNPVTSPRSWASRNRPYVATIGAHAFFA